MWFAVLLACVRPAVVDERSLSTATSASGEAVIEFDVDDADSIEFTLRGDGFLAVDRLTGPDGIELDWEEQGVLQRTQAVKEVSGETVLIWPVHPGTWTVELHAADLEGAPLEVDLSGRVVQKKRRGKTLPVTLRTSAGVDVPPGSLERFEDLYRRAGIDVEVTVEPTELPPLAPIPGDPDPILTEASDAPGLVIWLASDVQSDFLALAGNIPASTLPGQRGLVVVSASLMAGIDGVFDETEARMLGEAFAHEVGHFLGLFHPVELSFDTWDALDDTERCTTSQVCERLLGDNVMFPFLTENDTLRFSRDQRQLMRLHPAIR